jgi:hypothetical protein
MTKYAEELARKIESGEPAHLIANWFLECMGSDKKDWSDLSPLEHAVMQQISKAFEAMGLAKRPH